MKTILAFLAGILVGWWVKPKDKMPAEWSEDWIDKYFNSSGTYKPPTANEIVWVEPCAKDEELRIKRTPTTINDVLESWKAHTSPADNVAFTPPNCGVDSDNDTLADTQPIRTSSLKGEK